MITSALAVLSLLVALDGYGDQRASAVELSIARPARTPEGRVSFDLHVRAPGATLDAKCAPVLTLADGSKPALDVKVKESGGEVKLANVGYAAKEAAGPAVWKIAMECAGVKDALSFGVFGTAPNAHFIIPFGAKTRGEAESWLNERRRSNVVPSHNWFPIVLDSEWVLGMNPGFFVVVIGISDDKSVADTIAKELSAHDLPGTYVKSAWWPQPEALRALIVDEVADSGGIVPNAVEYLEIFMMEDAPYSGTNVRGRATIWSDKRALLVHTRSPAAPAKFELAVSAQQTQCDEKPADKKYAFEDKRVQHVKRLSLACFQGD